VKENHHTRLGLIGEKRRPACECKIVERPRWRQEENSPVASEGSKKGKGKGSGEGVYRGGLAMLGGKGSKRSVKEINPKE